MADNAGGNAMKGNNELHLNEATIIEALQEYLARRMPTTAQRVKSVEPRKGNFDATRPTVSTLTFVVTVEEVEHAPLTGADAMSQAAK